MFLLFSIELSIENIATVSSYAVASTYVDKLVSICYLFQTQ